MTREEREDAINFLKGYLDEEVYTEKCRNAHEMAIKSLEQEPCEDAISRQAVLNTLNNMDKVLDEDRTVENYKDLLKECYEVLPFVTPKIETGHWSRKTKVDAYDLAGVKTWGIKCQCDRCTFTTIVVEDFGYYTYCPNCGAKMEVEEK